MKSKLSTPGQMAMDGGRRTANDSGAKAPAMGGVRGYAAGKSMGKKGSASQNCMTAKAK